MRTLEPILDKNSRRKWIWRLWGQMWLPKNMEHLEMLKTQNKYCGFLIEEPRFNSNPFVCTNICNIPQSLDYLKAIPRYFSSSINSANWIQKVYVIGVLIIIQGGYGSGRMAVPVLSSLWNAWALCGWKQWTISSLLNKSSHDFASSFFKYIFIIYKILFHS